MMAIEPFLFLIEPWLKEQLAATIELFGNERLKILPIIRTERSPMIRNKSIVKRATSSA